jgi:hypothetical protein
MVNTIRKSDVPVHVFNCRGNSEAILIEGQRDPIGPRMPWCICQIRLYTVEVGRCV